MLQAAIKRYLKGIEIGKTSNVEFVEKPSVSFWLKHDFGYNAGLQYIEKALVVGSIKLDTCKKMSRTVQIYTVDTNLFYKNEFLRVVTRS